MILEEGYNVLEVSYHTVLNEGVIGNIFSAIISFFSKIIELLKSILNKIKQFLNDLFSGSGSSSSSSGSSSGSSSKSSFSDLSEIEYGIWDFSYIESVAEKLHDITKTAFKDKMDTYCPALDDLLTLEDRIKMLFKNVYKDRLSFDDLTDRCKTVFSSIGDKNITADAASAAVHRNISNALGLTAVTNKDELKKAFHRRVCIKEPSAREVTKPMISKRRDFIKSAQVYLLNISKAVSQELKVCEELRDGLKRSLPTENEIDNLIQDLTKIYKDGTVKGDRSKFENTLKKFLNDLISNISHNMTIMIHSMIACFNNVHTCLMIEIKEILKESMKIIAVEKFL